MLSISVTQEETVIDRRVGERIARLQPEAGSCAPAPQRLNEEKE